MDVHHLRVFLAVADELHFGRAAERLHLTPSPVSRTIKDFERELGTDLFIRRYHKVELTTAGVALHPHVRRIIEQIDAIGSIAAGAAQHLKRTVDVGATYNAPPDIVDDFFDMVESVSNGIDVSTSVRPSAELLAQVERGDLEMAMVHLPHDRPSLDSMVIAHYTFMVAVRADDELAGRNAVELTDLMTRTLTTGPLSQQPYALKLLFETLADAGITSVHELADRDAALLASHVRRTRGLTLTLAPSAGGAARVFDDPAFAVLPLTGNKLRLLLGITWRRADVDRDQLVRDLVSRAQRQWSGPPKQF